MAECWEFKAMLAQIARDLDSKDLEIIKYLCIGNVSKADLEDAGNSAVELWRLLQQRELIKPSDTAYLKRLLNGCRRDDLVTIVSNYEENQTTFTPTNQGPVIRNHSRVPLSPGMSFLSLILCWIIAGCESLPFLLIFCRNWRCIWIPRYSSWKALENFCTETESHWEWHRFLHWKASKRPERTNSVCTQLVVHLPEDLWPSVYYVSGTESQQTDFICWELGETYEASSQMKALHFVIHECSLGALGSVHWLH